MSIDEFEKFIKKNNIVLKFVYNKSLHELCCIYLLDEQKLLGVSVLVDPYTHISEGKETIDYYLYAIEAQSKIDDIYNKLVGILSGNLKTLDDYEKSEVACGICEEISVREQTLDAAKRCVIGDREQDYGTPESNFATIASFRSDYLDMNISAQQVADMMILMKISRIKNGGGTGDSYVDIAGYAACGNEILSKRKV